MHLQKEELAVVVLLLFAAVAACVLVVVTGEPPGAQYSSASKPGDTVVLEGLLVHKEKTGSGGHMLLTVKSGSGTGQGLRRRKGQRAGRGSIGQPGQHGLCTRESAGVQGRAGGRGQLHLNPVIILNVAKSSILRQ